MTSKQRIDSVLNFKNEEKGIEKQIGYFEIFSDVAIKRWCQEGFNMDVTPEEYFGTDIVLFGFKCRGNIDIAAINKRKISNPEWGYDLNSDIYLRVLEKDKYICISIPGPFQHIVLLHGYNKVLEELSFENDWIKGQFDKSVDYLLNMIDLISSEGFEFDGIWIWEDIAYDKGLFFSLSQYNKFLKEFHNKLIKGISKLHKKVFFHSDGDINSILPELIKFEIKAIHPLEKKFFNFKKIKNKFPDIVWMGNVDYKDFLKKRDNFLKENVFKSEYIYSSDSAIMDDISFQEYKQLSNLVRG